MEHIIAFVVLVLTIIGVIFGGLAWWEASKQANLDERLANLTEITINAENIEKLIETSKISVQKLTNEILLEEYYLKKLSDAKNLFQFFDTDEMKTKKEKLKRLRKQLKTQNDLFFSLRSIRIYYTSTKIARTLGIAMSSLKFAGAVGILVLLIMLMSPVFAFLSIFGH